MCRCILKIRSNFSVVEEEKRRIDLSAKDTHVKKNKVCYQMFIISFNLIEYI